MRLILMKDTELPDAEKGRGHKTLVKAGTYELEEIPNPYGTKVPWYRIANTQIGAVKTWFAWAAAYAQFPGHIERLPSPLFDI